MEKRFFTPGPSQLYPTVKLHMNQAIDEGVGSISHRGKKFEEIFFRTVQSLRALLNVPSTHHLFFLSSGTEGMERVLQNCVEKESFHFVNGSFSKRFFTIAEELKKEPRKYEIPLGEGFDFLKKEIVVPDSAELLCFTHNETSSGVITPIEEIYEMKKRYPDKLLALDIVSSAPYPKLDFTRLDCVFFSVQKLFGLFAGLAVMIVSPEAFEKSLMLEKKGIDIGSYHNFPTLVKFAEQRQTPETPPVLHIYLLHKIAEDMQKIGLETIRTEIDAKAKMLYDFFDATPTWRPFVQQMQFQSPTVITIQTNEHTAILKKHLEGEGMVVGSGYGAFKESQIRIANFPAISIRDVQSLTNHAQLFRF